MLCQKCFKLWQGPYFIVKDIQCTRNVTSIKQEIYLCPNCHKKLEQILKEFKNHDHQI